MNDNSTLDELFSDSLNTLPDDQRPRSSIDRSRLHVEWHDHFTKELAGWKKELTGLKNQPIGKHLILNRGRERRMKLFRREAKIAGLLPLCYAVREAGRRSLDP